MQFNKSILFIGLFLINLEIKAGTEHPLLIADYSFNGNANDYSGNNYNGVLSTTVPVLSAAAFGQCYTFDGTNSKYITITDNNAMSFTDNTNDKPFTISFWMKTASLLGNHEVINKMNTSSAYEWQIITGDSTMYIALTISTATAYIQSTAPLTWRYLNNWKFVVCTYQSGLTPKENGLKIYLNGVESQTTNTHSGTYTHMTNTTSDIYIGAQNQTHISKFNGSIDEIKIWNIVLANGDIQRLRNNFYPLMSNPSNLPELFDATKKINNVSTTRTPFASYKFNYSNTSLTIGANPTIYASYPTYAILDIFVNDIYNQSVAYTSATSIAVTLPAGQKTIEIVEGGTSKPTTTILGTFITSIKGTGTINPITSNVSEKIIFICNSIGIGGNADDLARQAFTRLFKIDNSKEVAFIGYGYGRLKDFGYNSDSITSTTSKITTLFSNVTTTKKIVLELGTNDYGLDVSDTTSVGTWLGNLVDAIHALDATIHVYVISPFYRHSESSLMTNYRIRYTNVCNGTATRKSFITYISGTTIMAAADYPTYYNADGLHLTVDGQALAKSRLYAIMYP